MIMNIVSKLPITDDVAQCFQAIIEDREPPKNEKYIHGYTGFLYFDKEGILLGAMHWEYRFNHMVKRYTRSIVYICLTKRRTYAVTHTAQTWQSRE